MVQAGKVHQIIKPQVIFGEGADLRHPLGISDMQRDFAAEFGRSGDQIAELRFE